MQDVELQLSQGAAPSVASISQVPQYGWSGEAVLLAGLGNMIKEPEA